jgi:hypothetical protein
MFKDHPVIHETLTGVWLISNIGIKDYENISKVTMPPYDNEINKNDVKESCSERNNVL